MCCLQYIKDGLHLRVEHNIVGVLRVRCFHPINFLFATQRILLRIATVRGIDSVLVGASNLFDCIDQLAMTSSGWIEATKTNSDATTSLLYLRCRCSLCFCCLLQYICHASHRLVSCEEFAELFHFQDLAVVKLR